MVLSSEGLHLLSNVAVWRHDFETINDKNVAMWHRYYTDVINYQFSLSETLYFYYPLFTLIVCPEMHKRTPDYRFIKAQVAIPITQQCDNR